MTITINWNTLCIEDWEKKFSQIPRSNLLQSYSFAQVQCPLEKQKARWGLIVIDGKEAGLVQVFEAGLLWNAFHAVIVDRGPLWFEGAGSAIHIRRTMDELNRQFPVRFGRKRRIIPEMEDGTAIRKMIDQTGFERLERKGYETVWMDLTQDAETLRAAMKSNWRNKLNKSERAGIAIEIDKTGEHFPWMIGIYAGDKAARDYGGPSPKFLQKYMPNLLKRGELLALRAIQNGTPVAFVILACHGRSATYLVGWSSKEGRDAAAHHLLLWEGVKMLQQKGIKDLDLGGVNDESADGIKTFKEGMGGRTVRYVGHYR